MNRKIKVIPFDHLPVNDREARDRVAHQAPLEIISPTSWELNTNTNVIQEQGVLGNTITYHLPFKERTYRLDWVGPRNEINKVRNYFINTSHRHFVFSGLSDQNVVTPSILLNSKGMLASVAEKHRFPGAHYTDYLSKYRYHAGYNVGSMGVRVSLPNSNRSLEGFLDTSDSAVGVVFLEKNTDYTFRLLPVEGYWNSDRNVLDFYAKYYILDGDFYDNRYDEEIRLSKSGPDAIKTIPSSKYDRILKLSLIAPISDVSQNFDGILSYIPPLIYKSDEHFIMDEYEDLPSLLMPVDDYVYNIISPNVAELSMNFKEISHVSE